MPLPWRPCGGSSSSRSRSRHSCSRLSRTHRRSSATACRTTRGSSTARGRSSDRLDQLDSLGVDVVRVTVDWCADRAEARRLRLVARRSPPRRPARARHRAARDALRHAGLGERRQRENWAPTSKSTFRRVRARTSAERYPYVHLWAIWNEPNQRRWLRPTSPRVVRPAAAQPGLSRRSTRRARARRSPAASRRRAGRPAACRRSPGSPAWRRRTRSSTRTPTTRTRSPGRDADDRWLRPLHDDHDGDPPAPHYATCSGPSARGRASG